MTPSNPSPGEQQFRLEVQRLETERGLNNEQAYLMVAAAVISYPVSHFVRDSITCAVNLFVANTDADAESLDANYKGQLARMKKYNILKLHQARMNTHLILSHLSSRPFEYYEARADTPLGNRDCPLYGETMGPGVEIVQLHCRTPNGDRYHAFSVGMLGVWLAKMIGQGLDSWKEFACCPICAITIPACWSASTAFDLVKESGGHGMDYKHAIMFDFDAEVDDDM